MWLGLPKDHFFFNLKVVSLNSILPSQVNQIGVKSLPILLPNLDVISNFDKNVSQPTNRLFTNCLESWLLVFIRNMLMPKLVSGKLRVFSS